MADLGIGVVDTDLDGTIRGWNGAAELLYGRDAEAMVGTPIGAVGLVDDDGGAAASMADELLSIGRWQGEVTVKDVAGLPLQLELRAMVLATLEDVVLEELGHAQKVRIGGLVQLAVRVK